MTKKKQFMKQDMDQSKFKEEDEAAIWDQSEEKFDLVY